MEDDDIYLVTEGILKANKRGRTMLLKHGDYICIHLQSGFLKLEVDYAETSFNKIRAIRGRVVDDHGVYYKDVYVDLHLPLDVYISRFWVNHKTKRAHVFGKATAPAKKAPGWGPGKGKSKSAKKKKN